jgi:hypothetical protein
VPPDSCSAYREPDFFTIVNYEQVLGDADDINGVLHPDVVVLDEAQRIKNWQTKTARRVKSPRSPYAFVLTGTPVENRIDELYRSSSISIPKSSGRCSASIAISMSSTSVDAPWTTRISPGCANACAR